MQFKSSNIFKCAVLLSLSLALNEVVSASQVLLSTTTRSQECPIRFSYHKPYTRRTYAETASRKGSFTQNVESRLTNGDLVEVHFNSGNELADYMAVLLEYDIRFLNSTIGNGIPFKVCSAAVVAPSLLVSSASCAIGKIFALVGSDIAIKGGNFKSFNRTIARVIPDPRFDIADFFATMKYDFAFVELNTDLPSRVKKMRVAGDTTLPARDTFTRTSGYGNYANTFSSPNDDLFLNQLDLPTFDEEACQRRYKVELGVELSIDVNSQICVGYFNRSKKCHLCEGDLGGPLIQYDKDGVPVLVGVSSYNGQIFDSSNTVCKIRDIPTVFTRSGQYIEDFTDYRLDIVQSSEVEVIPNLDVSSSPTPTMELPSPSISPSTTPVILGTDRPSNIPSMNPSETPIVSPSPMEEVDGEGISGGVIGGIVGSVLGFVLLVIVYLVWRNFSKDDSSSESSLNDPTHDNPVSSSPSQFDVHHPTGYTPKPVQQPETIVNPITHPTPPTIISLS